MVSKILLTFVNLDLLLLLLFNLNPQLVNAIHFDCPGEKSVQQELCVYGFKTKHSTNRSLGWVQNWLIIPQCIKIIFVNKPEQIWLFWFSF